MNTSSIKKDLGKLIINLAVVKINRWAEHQLNTLRYNSIYPICVPISNKSFILGPFQIDELGINRWQVTLENKVVHVFYSKKAAVYYAAFNKCKQYTFAENLLNDDKLVAKLYDDLELYGKKIAKKTKKTDEFKFQLNLTRYLDVKSKFNRAKNDLEKRLNSAKYIKVWDH